MLGRLAGRGLAQGVGLVIRSGAAPLVVGARLAGRLWEEPEGIPAAGTGLATTSKVVLDELFFATELVLARFLAPREHARVAREVRRALHLYGGKGWLDRPALYHEDPPPLEVESIDEPRTPWVPYRHLRFASGYEPHAGEPGRRRWLSYAGNRTAHVRLIRHPGPPRPWLVCVPGYRMGHAAVDLTGFRARWLHRELGLNLAIPVLPLHGPRRIGLRGGDGFFTGDVMDTLHAQAQAVWDVRRLVAWLIDQGAPGVGMYGVSLGGYTAALVASLEPRLDCVIAGIPAVDFVRLVRHHAPALLVRVAERAGFPFREIERVLRVVSPLAIPPRVPRERRFVYAGLADRLASPDHARDLWEHWERPRMAWYDGGHVSFLWEQKVRALVTEALGATGLCQA